MAAMAANAGVTDEAGGGQTEAGLVVKRVMLGTSDIRGKKTFLSEFFKDRARMYETKLPTKKDVLSGHKTVPDVLSEASTGPQPFHMVGRKLVNGPKQVCRTLSPHQCLFAARGALFAPACCPSSHLLCLCPRLIVPDDGKAHGIRNPVLTMSRTIAWLCLQKFGRSRAVHWFMANAASREALQQELETLGDFGVLPNPRMMVVRMELLMSEVMDMKLTQLEFMTVLKEEWVARDGSPMADGCGFIGEDLLCDLLGEKEGTQALAIQVRVVAPAKGIFKGVLMRRRGLGKEAELLPSMRKVPPSRLPERQKECWVLIHQVLQPTGLEATACQSLCHGNVSFPR